MSDLTRRDLLRGAAGLAAMAVVPAVLIPEVIAAPAAAAVATGAISGATTFASWRETFELGLALVHSDELLLPNSPRPPYRRGFSRYEWQQINRRKTFPASGSFAEYARRDREIMAS